MTLLRVLSCIGIGYFLGSINPALMIGKIKGYDPRTEGSLNAGASNTVIMAGKLAGLLVAVLDILKALIAWKLCEKLYPGIRIAGILGSVSAMLGHMFSVWMRFKGGKGLACMAGLCLGYDPKMLLILLGIAVIIVLITNYVCYVTVSMSVAIPVYFWLASRFLLGALILAVPIIPVFLKHRINFRRIKSGEELKISFLFHRDKELERIGVEDK